MHLFIGKPSLATCPKCGAFVRPHTACSKCGFYRGREAINVLEKMDKKERKKKEKEMAEQEKQSSKPLNMEEMSKE